MRSNQVSFMQIPVEIFRQGSGTSPYIKQAIFTSSFFTECNETDIFYQSLYFFVRLKFCSWGYVFVFFLPFSSFWGYNLFLVNIYKNTDPKYKTASQLHLPQNLRKLFFFKYKMTKNSQQLGKAPQLQIFNFNI